MKQSEAYELLCEEYLSNLEAGCNQCIAEIYCIKNNLRTGDRQPTDDCPDKIKRYLREH